jgi:hypothetical protein
MKSASFSDFLAFCSVSRLSSTATRTHRHIPLNCTPLSKKPVVLALLLSMGEDAILANASTDDGSAAKQKVVGEMTIDDCLSQFDSYSADDLCFVGHQTVYQLLLSPLLMRVMTTMLPDLEMDRSEFHGQLEMLPLSKDGHSHFTNKMSLDELSDVILLKIVAHLKRICRTNDLQLQDANSLGDGKLFGVCVIRTGEPGTIRGGMPITLVFFW